MLTFLKLFYQDGTRMEAFELPDHPYFVGVQYHPEYLTRPLLPSPPYLGLILASISKSYQYSATKYTNYYIIIQNN